ncbi:hypothetical protein JXM83_01025 [Candidatus Woesearchaeota archaeon]|nr:hypothetical protein [Candidatus Woesearchaeota archaeon]
MRLVNKKGDIWVSAVLYMMIAVAVVLIVLKAGVPQVEKMQDKMYFSKAKQTMLQLNDEIRAVASEGFGSQRIVPIEIDKGTLDVKDNRLVWQMTTKSKIMEPRTKVSLGNLIITANADVSANEYANYYLLSNSRISVNITRFNSIDSPGAINTNDLIQYMDYQGNTVSGTFSFLINNDQDTAVGTGYTYILEEGNDLGFATVVAHVNSTKFEYDLEITLESQADFIAAKVKNLKVN